MSATWDPPELRSPDNLVDAIDRWGTAAFTENDGDLILSHFPDTMIAHRIRSRRAFERARVAVLRFFGVYVEREP